jgi:putative transport protein
VGHQGPAADAGTDRAARWILIEFGLLVFNAGIGLNAGGEIVATFRQTGPALILAAVFVVSLPVVLGYAFGRKVLGLDPVILLGALPGSMTSGPALNLLTRQANSSAPALGYDGTFALASIIATIAGTLIL